MSPRAAYSMTLRVISEIAVAMSASEPGEKPSPAARSRPCWRACTMSGSRTMGMCDSPSMVRSFSRALAEHQQPFLQVQRRRDAGQREAELHHRERHLGLDADD